MLAREYISKLIDYAHQATNKLDSKANEDMTELDFQRILGDLDCILFELEAAQCILGKN
ncbi:hypothetical protein [Cytobacillus praedii]|uniref:hypothetical protein n=1 Tax=Cytobacillus praedii TaxID=1742358 RepID=UPI002E225681|nr:hypothetical protein [Cytobacillus praedii]